MITAIVDGTIIIWVPAARRERSLPTGVSGRQSLLALIGSLCRRRKTPNNHPRAAVACDDRLSSYGWFFLHFFVFTLWRYFF